jgi:RNA polymerase sigma factor (TIGR02999 family)
VDAKLTWQNRAHFIAIAANTMRHILVDHARAKQREKRGGDAVQVTLHETSIGGDAEPDILDLEDILTQLAKFDARKAKVIELSFFGGLTYEEIAEVLDISAATVDRELRFAKAWLYRELNEDNPRP